MSDVTRLAPLVIDAVARPDADMGGTDEDLEHWPRLRGRLLQCREILVPAFQEADRHAQQHQWFHRCLVWFAAICGTVAMLLAILQLAYPKWFARLEIPEFLAVVVAAVAVALGVITARQTGWLLERHRAERYRLAKFRFLTNPALWGEGVVAAERRAAHLRVEAKKVHDLTDDDFAHRVEKEEMPEKVPPMPPQVEGISGELDELIDCYRVKRLGFQKDIFADRANRNRRMDRLTRHLPPACFFLSILAALIHFGRGAIRSLQGYGHGLDSVSLFFILLAAALPVLGAGVRTLRPAHEFARNRIRTTRSTTP